MERETGVEFVNRLISLGTLLTEPKKGPNGETLLPALDGGSFKYQVRESDQPRRIEENPVFQAADSFCEYVREFKNKGDTVSQLFADAVGCRFICALDWHGPDGKPSHRAHNATYKPGFSAEWLAWDAFCGLFHKQDDTAHFIEEWAHTIVTPDGATMLECARDLQVHANVTVKSRKDLQSGFVDFTVSEEGQATTSNNIQIPKSMRIRIPVFFGEEPIPVDIFFRFNARPGAPLAFKLDIHQRDKMLNDAFLAIVKRIGEGSEIVPKLGVPNAGGSARPV